MYRGYENSIFTCLDDDSKKFVKTNAQSESDVLPLCTYIRQLQAAGRLFPKQLILKENQLEKIRCCYNFLIPEPGSLFGVNFLKQFLHPKQQSNFDIKKPKSIIEKRNNLCRTFYSNPEWKQHIDNFMATSKYEMLLSVKNSFVVYMSFVLKTNLIISESDFEHYVLNLILRFCMCIQLMEIKIKNDNNEIYFIVYVQKKMEDYFLYELYNLYESIQLIFTSNRNFFTDKDLIIMNSITFLYCFLTDRYKPEKENENDEICNYMAKFISTITLEIGGKSLKRNGLSKYGIGPLTFVISEAGLMETAKLNGTLKYPVFENEQTKQFKIDSVFERIFLNLPIKHGVLFYDCNLISK